MHESCAAVPIKTRWFSGGMTILVGSARWKKKTKPVSYIQVTCNQSERRERVFTFHVKRGIDGRGPFRVFGQTGVLTRVICLHAVYLQRAVVVDSKPRPLHGLRGVVLAPERPQYREVISN